ncbi:glycosyltransferase [Agrobacterium sp. Ap1]|uniref:glycosyltransferase family A protein n=1 Tax=Agrobacterium sp. Ap1 TaxID=2815337 RepID=UPI001A8E857C|nr:glycosyltransferase family A protein [Agrobacterium sp. Ap1]MBO0143016.1 glycosyltransferase [Agrobacterium sp. Ap1]
MLTPKNTLICIFSYNMGVTLERCIQSTLRMCPGFDLAIVDDQSEDNETRSVLERHKNEFRFFSISQAKKEGKKHGNLYENIQSMCDLALREGYEYIFLVQDDMQFVRPLDENICRQYSDLFAANENVLQVDPRFLRRSEQYEVLEELKAYQFAEGDPRRSYADVGILRLSILKSLAWTFRASEGENKRALAELGYVRLFPYSPIITHVPFPVTFRNGKKRPAKFLFYRGEYEFHEMTPSEQQSMDSRPIQAIPYFRKYLRPKNMVFARLVYALVTDGSALR